MRRRGGALGVTLASVLLAGCSGGGAGQLVDNGPAGSGTNIVRVAPADRDGPPEIAGTTLAGDPIDVADLRGDVVVLNVWGAWCAPCREEMPSLVEASRSYADQDQPVAFVGLNVRDNEDRARAMERTFDVPYPSIADHDGDLQLSLRDSVPPQSVPSTVVLDPEGRVAVTVVGKVTHSSLTSVVDDVLAETARG